MCLTVLCLAKCAFFNLHLTLGSLLDTCLGSLLDTCPLRTRHWRRFKPRWSNNSIEVFLHLQLGVEQWACRRCRWITGGIWLFLLSQLVLLPQRGLSRREPTGMQACPCPSSSQKLRTGLICSPSKHVQRSQTCIGFLVQDNFLTLIITEKHSWSHQGFWVPFLRFQVLFVFLPILVGISSRPLTGTTLCIELHNRRQAPFVLNGYVWWLNYRGTCKHICGVDMS